MISYNSEEAFIGNRTREENYYREKAKMGNGNSNGGDGKITWDFALKILQILIMKEL